MLRRRAVGLPAPDAADSHLSLSLSHSLQMYLSQVFGVLDRVFRPEVSPLCCQTVRGGAIWLDAAIRIIYAERMSE